MTYDLMLKTSPDRATLELIERLKTRVAASQALSFCEMQFHDANANPFGDLEQLEEAFEEGEASKHEYRVFCKTHALDPASDLAAGRFLENPYGIAILSVNLTNDPVLVQAAFKELRSMARDLGLTLHDPQAGTDIPDSYSAALPPAF